MGDLHGFAGRILYVNLSTGNTTSKPLDKRLAENFIGGMGINSWLVYNHAKRGVAPLSPENPLVFGVGPLVGTIAPGASRTYVSSRSPTSGFYCNPNAGNSAGIMMKKAGYDHLVITGRSERPVYLRISDDEVEIRDAGQLWGRDTWETTDLIRKEIGDYWVDCIGPAAESLVKYSAILCNRRSSYNKNGPGTVMGSKNLKAIAARGTRGVRVADPERFIRLTDKITKGIVADPDVKAYRTYGGPLPQTSQPGFTYEEFRDRIAERPYACLSCPLACKHLINLRDGDYKGLIFRVSHLAALAGHNRLGRPENWDELVKVVELEYRYGVEASVATGTLSYLVECFEHGVLTEKEIGFVPKRGGRALRELITLMVRREGIGDLAAEGMMRASEKVGKDSEKYAVHHKGIGRHHGLEREVGVLTVGSLTNPHGDKSPEFALFPFANLTPSVDRSIFRMNPESYRRFCASLKLSREAADRVCDGPDGFNVGRLTKWAEDYSATYMSMGFCYRPPIARQLNLEKLRELYVAATGLEVTPTQLLEAGERIFNILKAFNVKMGATRRDDMPSRGATWPPDRPLAVAGKEYGTLNQILDQYYDERGWTVESGVPTREKLVALGLQRMADDMGV